jgi:dTDP-4-dehydrorhamnose 3,5-epimerase
MKFIDSGLAGAWIVEHEPAPDDRGAFTELWERDAFGRRGLFTAIDQTSSAYNKAAGTLRGLHFQVAPFEQAKLVSCIAGAVYDVIIDLRPASPGFKRWFGLELRADEPRALYVPAGFAHGYLTLHDHTTVHYLIAGKYSPEHARGVRWNDPAFGIRWPAAPTVIAPRDAQYADFTG